MSVRTWRLFAASVIISVVGGSVSAVPAAAASRISYSGRSVALKAVASSTTTVFADTGALSSSGGALEASSLSALVSQTVTADTLHATTIGQGDRVRSEASVANIVSTIGLNTVSADFAMSRTMAVSQGGSASVSGQSHVDSLVVNGVPVVVTGQANQIVALIDGQLVVNEQISSGTGNTGSLTVNALHLSLSGGTDVVLGSSNAGVVAGSQNCSSADEFMTGGGWLSGTAGSAKRSFGVIGGVKQGQNFFGHLVYINRVTNHRVEGRINLYAPGSGNLRVMNGTGQANGEASEFKVTVADNGEPGTLDSFSIEFTGAGGGTDTGTLAGGNLQLHQVCR